YNLANHDACVAPYPGIVEVIREIRRAGLTMGLVTSKNRSGAERGLRVCEIEPYIDIIVGADDVENPKPHGEPVEKAVAFLGADRERTVFVGDSVHDMASGRSAGVRTAAVLWGPFGRSDLTSSRPDYWLERPADLLEILGLDQSPANRSA